MINVLLLDVYNKRKAERVEIEPNDLDKLYELLDCRCIDIVTRKVGNKWFDIVCDDEGLFKERPVVSAADKNGQPMLVGNLIFAHHDEDGNLTGLNEEDFEELDKNMAFAFSTKSLDLYKLVINMSWS